MTISLFVGIFCHTPAAAGMVELADKLVKANLLVRTVVATAI